MNFSFYVDGRLPCLNDIIAIAQKNRYAYGSHKKRYTEYCAYYVMASKCPVFQNPVNVVLDWYEPNRRRDLDNISTGVKYILDALVMLEKIEDDSQQWVKSITHRFHTPDPQNPRILVTLEEVLSKQ